MSKKVTKPKKTNNKKRVFSHQASEFDHMIIDILNATTKIKRLNSSDYLQLNANFIYLLAIFERFIGHLNVHAISKKKPIKDKYLMMFTDLCDDKIKTLKKGLGAWRKYYNKPSKMISDYSILEKEKNGMVIMRKILRDEVLFSEEMLTRELKFFHEARARRNLLAHRGREPDKIYYDDLKKGNIDNKIRKRAFRYLYSVSTKFWDYDQQEEYSRKKRKNPSDNPIDLSVTPKYLLTVCFSLIYIKESLIMDLKDDKISTNLHDFMKCAVKTNNDDLLACLYSIYRRKIRAHSVKLADLAIDEKVNYLILREYLFSKKIIKKNEVAQKNTQKIIDSIKAEDHKYALYIKPLLQNYVDKDKREFFKNTKEFLNFKKEVFIEIRHWLMFRRYLRYKEFKDLFKLKKEEFFKDVEQDIKTLKKQQPKKGSTSC